MSLLARREDVTHVANSEVTLMLLNVIAKRLKMVNPQTVRNKIDLCLVDDFRKSSGATAPEDQIVSMVNIVPLRNVNFLY